MNISSTFAASDGSAYEIQMGRWSRRLAEPFLDFAGVTTREEVLDVGCGTGNLAFAVRARADVKLVKGLDFSAAYVDSAKHRNKDPRITFEVGDATAMPYADGSFDRVLSCNSYVVRLSHPPTPHERLQLLAARLEARPIAVLPHVCRSIDEWAERYASLAQP